MREILVAGGAGYIGSHTCVLLLESGFKVVIADNLCNSRADTIDRIELITGKRITFSQIDVADRRAVNELFSEHKFEGVIHFAGLKSVKESIERPLTYYSNNLGTTLALAEACAQHGVTKFVFSSSATVYGQNSVPFVETMATESLTSPYGETKAMSERILSDTAMANPGFSVSLLRYFNPVGAHDSGLIGEAPVGAPGNLMPAITQVACGMMERLKVFGSDYQTIDGTAVRDYIHVMDLAEGHIAAFERAASGVQVYNLGTGKGTSVLQLIKVFNEANHLEVPYEIVDRRPGDIAECYADVAKAKEDLGWVAKRTLAEMCRDSYRFETNRKRWNIPR